jgi:hypothetical protein
MDFETTIRHLIDKPEGAHLEFKSVLLPSRLMAIHIAGFANAGGGYLILGVSHESGQAVVQGLSQDFRANDILHKALDLLSPAPSVVYKYVPVEGKNVYAIGVEKSTIPILLEGKLFKRHGAASVLTNPPEVRFTATGYSRLKTISQYLEARKKGATSAYNRLADHYQGILKIADDPGHLLYPIDPQTTTAQPEGKILSRILFSSLVDNFETYLSDLLYEIFLANPSTLKSTQQVTVEEVLNCADMQEFVRYWAKEKLGKLLKGSVKGFIRENRQISALAVLDSAAQNQIEAILQIRHLYAHRNGIVDEKFLQFFPGQFSLNTEHQISLEGMCDHLEYLQTVAGKIDEAAIARYRLATIE